MALLGAVVELASQRIASVTGPIAHAKAGRVVWGLAQIWVP
jgi:hypothetical protein